MKKMIGVLLAAAVLAGTMTACGGSPVTSSSVGTSSASTTSGAQSYDIPVPDFLDAAQQQLYYDAYHMFVWFALDSDQGRVDQSADVHETNGNVYYRLNKDAFASWDDFYYRALAVFTKRYFEEELNDYPTFIAVDDAVYSTCGARGAASDWKGPDSFELVSQSDERIEFRVVGTYQAWEENGDEYEQTGDIYTESYPLVMVRENGDWRFSQFNITF